MKRPSFAKVSRYAVCGVAGAMIAMLGAKAAGLRFNATPSIPVGVYRATGGTAQKGDLVAFCPPAAPPFLEALRRRYIEPGDCPSGSYEMMKRILAAKGDRVEIGGQGVRINGRLVPDRAPQLADGAGRALPRLNAAWTLGDGEILVLGDSAASFDGRYFGPISARQVTASIKPVVTW